METIIVSRRELLELYLTDIELQKVSNIDKIIEALSYGIKPSMMLILQSDKKRVIVGE